MTGNSQQDRPATEEACCAIEWKHVERANAKMQVAVKQALRDWFEAARKGSEGVSGTEIVDAAITLGLNYDYKQVQRIVFAEARATNGLLCSVKSFTAALLACCSSDLEKEGLFRLLRGEGDWRGFGLEGGGDTRLSTAAAAAETVFVSSGQAFITRLAAYRRKVLMATVAEKFPTPGTASLRMPDCENTRQLETGCCQFPESDSSVDTARNSAPSPRTPRLTATGAGCAIHTSTKHNNGIGSSCGQSYSAPVSGEDGDGSGGSGRPSGGSTASSGTEDGICVVPARTISTETRKRYDAVLEGIVLAQERNELHSVASVAGGPTQSTEQESISTGQQEQAFPREAQPRLGSSLPTAPVEAREKGRPAAGCRPRTTPARQGGRSRSAAAVASAPGNGSKGHQRRGAPGQTASAGNGNDIVAWSNSSGRTTMVAARNGQPQRGASAREVVRNTAEGIRDALRKRELHLATVEARWENYDVMKRRWWRRTPIGILNDDGLDEADRSYSRVSRPSTSEGTGSSRLGFAGSGSASSPHPWGRVCSASTCRRPCTAPAGITAQGSLSPVAALGVSSLYSTTSPTFAGTSSGYDGRSSTSRRRGEAKPLTLGPIPLDEGKQLRYPLLQLDRERRRTAKMRCARRRAQSADATKNGSSDPYVDIPVARDWKGRWRPHLARVPCGLQPV